MGKLGERPIIIPKGVSVVPEDGKILVTGPKGKLSLHALKVVNIQILEDKILIHRKNDTKQAKVMQGTIRAYLQNMILGVSEGFRKELEIVGAGYRGEVKEDRLVLSVGYSHPVILKAPEGISLTVEKSLITVQGIDKFLVGQTAAQIREVRKPEPYKGVGIRYKDEVVRRKPGKQAAKAGV